LFAATFMGESNILEAEVVDAGNGDVSLRTALADVRVEGKAPATAAVHLSVRPEHVKLEPPRDAISLGRVVIKEMVFQGAHRRCHATSLGEGATELLLRVPVDQTVKTADELEIFVRREDIVLLAD
jgi:ABC-type Fe3+/spermidine/putrescine transport system ATPase subunit